MRDRKEHPCLHKRSYPAIRYLPNGLDTLQASSYIRQCKLSSCIIHKRQVEAPREPNLIEIYIAWPEALMLRDETCLKTKHRPGIDLMAYSPPTQAMLARRIGCPFVGAGRGTAQ